MARVKVIKTRHVIEVYQYENMPVNKGGRTKEESTEWKTHREKNGKKKRDQVRRLISANFGSGDRFVTLTFANGSVADVRSLDDCYRALDVFLKRLRRAYPELKGIIVTEFQDKSGRGAVHYHMICNLPFVKKEELARLWGNGFVKVNRIDKVDNVGAYIVKYMSKDLDDGRLRKRKSYYRVGKIEEPDESWLDDPAGLAELIGESVPVYESRYGSEYHGKILYHQYNLERKLVASTEG